MKRLFFVRHGLSIMNETGFFSGRTETNLSQTGIDQAIKAGKKMKDFKIDLIISSPMKRTVHTAELIAKQIKYPVSKILINDLFIERDFGPLEGSYYIPNLKEHPGVETSEQIQERANEAYSYLKSLTKYDNILIVSHGSFGRALRHSVNNKIPFYMSEGFRNGHIVQLI